MALDTTIGGASADSFGTLAEFQAYAAAMGWTLTATDAAQESYLRRAAAYLNRTYEWIGRKASSTQSMQWPRSVSGTVDGWSVDSTTIPQPVIDAQFELAWLLHDGVDIFPTIENGALTSKSESVDVISTSYTYAGGREIPVFTEIQGLLAGYIKGTRGGGMRPVMAVRA